MIHMSSTSVARDFLSRPHPPLKKLSVKACSRQEDAAAYLNSILETVEDNMLVSFETGAYLLHAPMRLRNVKNVVIDGNNSVFIQHFDREAYGEGSSDIFHLEDCEDLTLRNFVIDSSDPVNISGKVIRTEQDSFEMRVDEAIPFSGKELFITGYSFSEEGFPTYVSMHPKELDRTTWDRIGGEIPCTNPRVPNIPHEKLDDRTVRIHSFLKASDGSYPGPVSLCENDTFCMRHAYFGPVACLFRHCRQVLVEDVNVRSFGGMVFVILPRCSDFSFRRVTIAPKEPHYQFLSSNADGIHVSGLMGKLTLQDCMFRNLGDDILNAHTQAMTAVSVTDQSIQICYDKVNGYVSPRWAQPGDILYVYDPDTLMRKKDITVTDFRDSIAYFESSCDAQTGDIVVNSAYNPEILIENCVSYGLRSRAYVIQGATRCVIRNCEFYNVTGAAVYVSSAFQVWMEAGPSDRVEISNNLISGCSSWGNEGYAAVNVWVRGNYENAVNIHKHISIHGNLFRDLAGQPVYVTYSDQVSVQDNVFANCTAATQPIIVERGKDVDISGNVIL